MPLLHFRVWTCGGQKTIVSQASPTEAWSLPGEPFVMVRSPTSWSSLCSVAACRILGGEDAFASPRWFVRDGAADGEHVEKPRLEASVLLGDPRGLPSVSLASLDALVLREFRGVPKEKILVEALWSCSESGPSLGLAPRRSVGAVLRITGPTDEPDGYREILPA